MEIKHCSHPHPLMVCHRKTGLSCSGCDRPLLGQVYGCTACDFYLHKSCSELPPEIQQHPFHPKHPLSLYPKPPPVFPLLSNQVWCDACWKTNLSFTFHCKDCAFNIDIDCASLMPTLKCEQVHDHPLALFQNLSLDPKCQVCGSICNFFVLRCVPCNFNVHVQCVATLPQTVEISCHRHPLTLTDSLVEDHSDEFVCDACEQERKPGHTVYYCEECDFVAHVYCGVSEISPTMLKKLVEQDGFVDSAMAELDQEMAVLRGELETITASLEVINGKLEALEKERLQYLSSQRGGGISFDPSRFLRPFSNPLPPMM